MLFSNDFKIQVMMVFDYNYEWIWVTIMTTKYKAYVWLGVSQTFELYNNGSSDVLEKYYNISRDDTSICVHHVIRVFLYIQCIDV